MKKMMMPLAMALMAMLSLSAFATEIAVGGKNFSAKDLQKIDIYEVCPGMELCYGKKLRVSGKVSIGSGLITDTTTAGIYAHHGIDIELMPGSFLHIDVPLAYDESGKPKTQYGIAIGNIGGAGNGGLHIYGPGTLSITHVGENGGGIVTRSGNVMVMNGASVRVQTKSGVSAIVAGDPAGLSSGKGGVSVVGALVETTGGRIFANGGGMLLDRAVVNVLSHGSGLQTWGDMTIQKSFCTSIAKSGNALYTRKVLNLDDSVVYALSKEDTCVEVTYDSKKQPSVIGKGLYKFATLGGEEKCGIDFGLPLTFDGGKLVTCTPDGCGIHSTSYTLTMNSGLIRNQYSMHIKDEFFVSRELMDAYDFVAGWKSLEYETEFDPYNAIELFLGDTLINWIEAASIDNPSGQANWMASASNLKMNGGTILTENTKYGMCFGMDSGHCKVSGGSLQPPIRHSSGSGKTSIDSPVDMDGNKLVCVTNVINEEAYSHVVSGWTAMLPPDYDTSSLYLDGQSQLYFWVPEEYRPVTEQSWTVTFDSNGGNGTMPAQKFKEGVAQTLIANAFTLTGYTFAGWATSADGDVTYADEQSITITSDMTLYAQWNTISPPAPTYYTVTFNANGGSVSPNSRTVAKDSSVGTLPVATREGYTFAGWFTASKGGDAVMVETIVTGDVTYYAHWTKIVEPEPIPEPTPNPEPTPTPVVEESTYGGKVENVEFAKAQVVMGSLYNVDGGVGSRRPTMAGTVELKFGRINAKRGIVKVSGTATLMDGGKSKKVAAKAVTMSLVGGSMYGTLAFKAPVGSMTFALASDGKFTLKNSSYEMVAANIGGALASGRHTFKLGEISFASGGELQEQLLPTDEPFSVSGGRWTFGKNASVKLVRDRSTNEQVLLVDTANGKTNLSSLKLTYTPKTGLFKGAFKVYVLTVSNGRKKLAKYTANVIGFVVDGVGYGEATVKRPAAAPWSVTVK